jgi:outer membrane murein-binding lipoprotein Lpp
MGEALTHPRDHATERGIGTYRGRMLRRLRLPAAAVLASGLLLSGCGSEGSPEAATVPVAADVAGQPVAATADQEPEADLAALLDEIGAAAEQLTTTRFTLAIRGPMSVDVTGLLDVTTDVPTLQARVKQTDLGLREVRLVDGTAYGLLEMPGMPGGWIEVPLPDLSQLPDLGAMLPDLASGPLADGLGEIVTDLERTPSAGGTTWTASIDVRRVAALLPMLAGSLDLPGMTGMPGMPDLGSLAGSDELPDAVDVSVAFDAGGGLSEVAATTDGGSFTLTLTDPGTPVEVEAPADTIDFASGFGWTALTPHG